MLVDDCDDRGNRGSGGTLLDGCDARGRGRRGREICVFFTAGGASIARLLITSFGCSSSRCLCVFPAPRRLGNGCLKLPEDSIVLHLRSKALRKVSSKQSKRGQYPSSLSAHVSVRVRVVFCKMHRRPSRDGHDGISIIPTRHISIVPLDFS